MMEDNLFVSVGNKKFDLGKLLSVELKENVEYRKTQSNNQKWWTLYLNCTKVKDFKIEIFTPNDSMVLDCKRRIEEVMLAQ